MNRLSKNKLAFIASLNLQSISFNKIVDIWTKYETAIDRKILINGKSHTLATYKESYSFLRNYLLKLPTQPLPFCKSDANRIPKPLWSLRPLIKGDRNSQRLALTIARTYEKIRLEIDYSNLSTITEELHAEMQCAILNLDKKFKIFLKRFTRKRKWYLGSLQAPQQPWSKVLTMLSKGPNGPAVITSHLDARAVVEDLSLYDSIRKLNLALGQSWITKWLVTQYKSTNSGNKTYHTGRLGFSAEPAGKTRIFAIGDYWSQLSLKPIQISLYRTLQSISMDATSDQDLGFSTLLKEAKGHPTYCFDLSSASDRIPAIMQKHRLELMSNLHVADNWYKVMTGRSFYVKATKANVRWSVGQPLGLLSSFPSFALWHHDFIQFAANWENYHSGKPLRYFKQYRLLGDDVVIFNTKVARRYQTLLKHIGLTINMNKSVLGDAGNNQIEFAKRLALNGQEMSSIKNNILTKDNIVHMLDLVDLLIERDYIPPNTGHHSLLRILKSKDLQRLRYLIWLRSSDAPTLLLLSGNASVTINREEIIKKIISKRTQNIIDKATKIKPLDMEEIYPSLLKQFKSIDVSCDGKTLADRSIGDLSGSHPIVLALTQTSRELQFLMFSVLDDLLPDEISPVEYLPVVSAKSYFRDHKDSRIYFSKLLLECLQETLDEKNQNIEGVPTHREDCSGT